jgi:F-box domain
MSMSASKAGLDALPTECLAQVLSHLGLRDAAAAVCASKRFLSATELPVAWEPRLARVYDLRLQVCCIPDAHAARNAVHL